MLGHCCNGLAVSRLRMVQSNAMREPMSERFFEDLQPGARFESESLHVNEQQLVEFAHKFDPQMFHLDRKTAERSIFKGLVASGWHTAAMTMRLFVQTMNFAQGAIGLGVDELRWPQAVRPGDRLRVLAWREADGRAIFEARVGDQTVVSNAYFEWR